MQDVIKPAGRFFNFLVRNTLGVWLKLRFRVILNKDAVRQVRPPFLVIGNHTSFWDPFLLSLAIKQPVHFVASDEYFRTPFMKFAISLAGGIPKVKNTRDTSVIRAMLKLKDAGAVLGVYPEGNRNWTGVTGSIYSSTAKLIHKLNIPVIAVKTTGGSLTQPRWGRHWRNGWMHLEYKLLFSKENLGELTEAEILEGICGALAHDDLAVAADLANKLSLPLRYSGRKLAEKLELLLFQCPNCRGVDTLKSKNDIFSCESCEMTLRFGEDGHFRNTRRYGEAI